MELIIGIWPPAAAVCSSPVAMAFLFLFFFFLVMLGRQWRRHSTILGMRVFPFLIIVINGHISGVILGLKDGDTSQNISLHKLPIDGVGFNGSSVSRSVELPIDLVRPNIDIGQLRD